MYSIVFYLIYYFRFSYPERFFVLLLDYYVENVLSRFVVENQFLQTGGVLPDDTKDLEDFVRLIITVPDRVTAHVLGWTYEYVRLRAVRISLSFTRSFVVVSCFRNDFIGALAGGFMKDWRKFIAR